MKCSHCHGGAIGAIFPRQNGPPTTPQARSSAEPATTGRGDGRITQTAVRRHGFRGSGPSRIFASSAKIGRGVHCSHGWRQLLTFTPRRKYELSLIFLSPPSHGSLPPPTTIQCCLGRAWTRQPLRSRSGRSREEASAKEAAPITTVMSGSDSILQSV